MAFVTYTICFPSLTKLSLISQNCQTTKPNTTNSYFQGYRNEMELLKMFCRISTRQKDRKVSNFFAESWKKIALFNFPIQTDINTLFWLWMAPSDSLQPKKRFLPSDSLKRFSLKIKASFNNIVIQCWIITIEGCSKKDRVHS